MSQALNWGSTKGEAKSNNVTYMKFNAGENRVRVVGNILRRYVYWVPNHDGSKSAPFENLDFSRENERFENNNPNPVKELGLFERNFKTGQVVMQKNRKTGEEEPKPLSSKKAYLTPVINRATGELEYMELKKGIFDGIQDIMSKVNTAKTRRSFVDQDYVVNSPMDLDIIFTKTGKGLDTEYKVDLLETLGLLQDEDEFEKMKELHEKDQSIVDELDPIEETFKRQTYDEQKEALRKWRTAPEQEPKDEEDMSDSEQEAMDELDD